MQVAANKTTILCPTKRFARGLQNQYAQSQLAAGNAAFEALPVQTLDNWLSEQINQAVLLNHITSAPRRLSQFEERYLWQSVIEDYLKQSEFPSLFDVKGLANNCIEANRYCVAWQLTLPEQLLAEESKAFLAWQAMFQTRCEQLNALESVRYFDWQMEQLEQGYFQCTEVVQFAGFDQTAPQENRLRDLLRAQGLTVHVLDVNKSSAQTVQHLILQDEKQEMQAIMAWAKQQHAEKPDIQLAIVVPQLQKVRETLTQLLDETFQPETLRPSQTETARIYNVSLGEPLSQQPMVEIALQLIRLCFSYQFEQQALSSILLSPFWSASVKETDARAVLESKLRDWLPQTVKWSMVQSAIDKLASQLSLSSLLTHINAGLSLVEKQKNKQSASTWASQFEALLVCLHWPGERMESSHEYQTHEAWQQCLARFAQLDFLGQDLTAKQAISLLSQLAQEQVFQVETTGAPQIQVLGIMEALSEPVDALWVMGMNDNQWPMPASPNPLIPAQIQRDAAVANADDAVQMIFARTIHQRLLHSAKAVVFSSSQLEGEKALRSSPLMEGITQPDLTIDLQSALHKQLALQSTATPLEHLQDGQAPAVATGEHVKGGTGLIQAQAICPAWAFYQYRLGARGLRTPKSGFDAADRGQLVHDALEQFWMSGQTPRHYVDLQQLTDEQREDAVAVAVNASITAFQNQQGAEYAPAMWALEAARMQRLINDWLDYELKRAVDFKVFACEVEHKVVIQEVEVTLKIDRVQHLPNGSLEIVDYKTGAMPSVDSWGTTRITNPQLPIYASYYPAEQTVSSVQFGMVKTSAHQYTGVSEENFETESAKRKPKFTQDFADWSALKAHWLSSIEAIVGEIKAGVAEVVFEDVKALQYCEVTPILRLQERVMQFEVLSAKVKGAYA